MEKEQLTNTIIDYVKNNLTELDENADKPYVIDESDESDKTIITTPSVYVRIEETHSRINIVVRRSKYTYAPKTALEISVLSAVFSNIDVTTMIESAIDNVCSNLFTNLNIEKYCDNNSRSIDDLINNANNDDFIKLLKHYRNEYINKNIKKHEKRIRKIIKLLYWYNINDNYVFANGTVKQVKKIVDKIAHDPYAEHFAYNISQDVDDNVYGYKVQSIAKLLILTADNAKNNTFNYRCNQYLGTKSPRVVDKAEEILNKLAEDAIRYAVKEKERMTR